MANIAVVRVKGRVRVRKEILDTLSMMRLYNKNYCVVLEDKPVNMGMIKKVKDYVTYGPIDSDTYKNLVSKRGEEYVMKNKEGIDETNKFLEIDGKKYRKYFRLSPPKKGYGRKGIKKSFVSGGALGFRGKDINSLIKRMI